jgi:hypothetical protein
VFRPLSHTGRRCEDHAASRGCGSAGTQGHAAWRPADANSGCACSLDRTWGAAMLRPGRPRPRSGPSTHLASSQAWLIGSSAPIIASLTASGSPNSSPSARTLADRKERSHDRHASAAEVSDAQFGCDERLAACGRYSRPMRHNTCSYLLNFGSHSAAISGFRAINLMWLCE